MTDSIRIPSHTHPGASALPMCLAGEIRRVDATSAEKGEICAICLAELAEEKEEVGPQGGLGCHGDDCG